MRPMRSERACRYQQPWVICSVLLSSPNHEKSLTTNWRRTRNFLEAVNWIKRGQKLDGDFDREPNQPWTPLVQSLQGHIPSTRSAPLPLATPLDLTCHAVGRD